jgi:hypothetical protein
MKEQKKLRNFSTRKGGSQHGLTHNLEMKQENKAWQCLAFTPISPTN